MEFQRTADPNKAVAELGPHRALDRPPRREQPQRRPAPVRARRLPVRRHRRRRQRRRSRQRRPAAQHRARQDPAHRARDRRGRAREPVRPRVWSYGLRNPWRFSVRPRRRATCSSATSARTPTRRSTGRGPRRAAARASTTAGPCREGDARVRLAARRRAPRHRSTRRSSARTSPTWRSSAATSSAIPACRRCSGRYLYGDANVGHLARSPRPDTGDREESGLAITGLSSFGQDACGRIYAASLNGPVYRVQDGAPSTAASRRPAAGRPTRASRA